MFFPNAQPSPIWCVQHLVVEVLALGATDVLVERHEDWWIVSSTLDWFLSDQSPEQQVRKLIPLPQVGPNASRVEVVILAFSEAVATRGGDRSWRVLAGPEVAAFVEQASSAKAGRAVAFRFATSSSSS
jgi:hypothetical protein